MNVNAGWWTVTPTAITTVRGRNRAHPSPGRAFTAELRLDLERVCPALYVGANL